MKFLSYSALFVGLVNLVYFSWHLTEIIHLILGIPLIGFWFGWNFLRSKYTK